ncbi:class I SAM-dependent methyltransferase [Phenylobacterium sp. VNQ135]|uniref:class I SAM-dependent methyltransferase n=1 Tax=Phenylobacterium sp. VNQ135 TaxID=3400922 RepID=UPI003C11A991
MSETIQPNRDQAAQWNEASGPAWVELQAVLDRMLAPFVDVLTDEAFPGPGGQVLDIGCGAGATTLAMAGRLGPNGRALGVDISGPLVTAARARAEAEGVGNAAFVEADAQTYPFEAEGFDAVISRFGVMFFEDPEAAFANIRRAARRDATLAFVAWRSPADNPFMTAAWRAAAPFLSALPTPEPNAPGQFGFADGERTAGILRAAGWRDVEVRPLDAAAVVAVEDLRRYLQRMGPVGAALRLADEATRTRVTDAVEAAYAPFIVDGAARYVAACWKVTARA